MLPHTRSHHVLGAVEWREPVRAVSPRGRPLPEDLRRHAEELFQQDFSQVRIHPYPRARRLGVRAFTIGTRIYIVPEEYAPASEKGLQLLGHELAHVVQQRTGRVRNPHGYGIALVRAPSLEAEASRMGEAFVSKCQTTRLQVPPSSLPAPHTAQLMVASPASHGALLAMSISELVRTKVKEGNLQPTLDNALSLEKDPILINLVFEALSVNQLEQLPEYGGEEKWSDLEKARLLLGDQEFSKWLKLVGLAVTDIPDFRLLLSDKKVEAAYHKSVEILEAEEPPPPLIGKSYAQIVGILQKLHFHRLESYTDSRADGVPYGQDVWANKLHMVVRIKVGGRSLEGRFRRPPHVVKEITKKPGWEDEEQDRHDAEYIICKLTDDNILIPAGTKYSAKDMLQWFEKKSRRKLDKNAWKSPAESGDAEFAELHQLWAERAHIPIGAVPLVPRVPLKMVPLLQRELDVLENQIQVGRMERHGIDHSVIDDDPSNYLSEEEFMRWCFLRRQLGID